jgi:4-amino-4-deoxy-L-arabinose transferase-like glycosyltransferase
MTDAMQKSFLNKIKNISGFWWVFLAVVVVGIFLRTWHHHDWLRFNADQGRDAQIVSDIIDGKTPLILLGPKAGGTQFRLGPMFYYFEMAAAKIFGNAPDKMAYPDLATGILCIPLLFLYLRKYFEKYASLVLTAIFAVSAYAIRYARFAWNPNSSPFWAILFLYAVHEIVSEKENRKFFWAVAAGVALGIAVQLHTTLLAILPATAIIIFGYFSFKDKKMLKYFFVVAAAALLLNIPQLISEQKTGGKNMKAFFGGMETKQKAEKTVLSNVVQSASCWVQGNLDIVSGYEISDTCDFKPARNARETAVFFLGLVFVLGGTILGFRYFFKEKEKDQKSFLVILLAFSGISYLIFLKFAFELSMRFYLPLIFLPFVLLGLWIRFFREKFNMPRSLLLLIIAVPLVLSNLFFVQKYFSALAEYGNPGGGSVNVVILKEAEIFSQFIVNNSNGEKDAYIGGDGKFLFKGYKPIRYLVGRSNIKLSLAEKKSQMLSQYFFVASLKKKEKMFNDKSIRVLQYKDFGSFSMLLVQKNTPN